MELRAITEDELAPFYLTFFRTMGFGQMPDPAMEREKTSFAYDRSVAAVDDGEIIGTAYSHVFQLTLPGGAQIPTCGVTAISVASTHRRRGIITDIKRRQLNEARDRGEPAAILVASEGRIYRRFGYGIATQVTDIRIEPRDARIEHRPTGGRVRIVTGERMDEVLPGLHASIVATRPGMLARPKHFWESVTADRNVKTVNLLHEDASGAPDGFARYDINADWKDALPSHKVTLHELLATNDAAALELWTFVLNIDLVREVNAAGRPVDEPLRWMLDEPRAVRSKTMRDQYWFRPLDVAAVLAARTYATPVDLTIEVHDPLLDVGGTFALSGGPDGASCERTTGAADLRMTIAELGSLALGGITATELCRGGRIEEVTDGAARRADLAFVTTPRPWGDVYF